MEKPNEGPVLLLVPLEYGIDRSGELKREVENKPPLNCITILADARRKPRFKIEVDITINSRTCGELKGHTVDISESGISAMLILEVPLGEVVELNFKLPFGPVTIHAIVRQRNAFRYGFEFVDQGVVHEFIRRTCRDLAIDQSLNWPPIQ